MLDKSDQVTVLITGPLKSRFTKEQFLNEINVVSETFPKSDILIITWHGEVFDDLKMGSRIKAIEIDDPGSYNPFASSSNSNLKRQIVAFNESIKYVKTEYVLRIRLEFKILAKDSLNSELNLAIQKFESNSNIKIGILEYDLVASLIRLDSVFNLSDSFFIMRRSIFINTLRDTRSIPCASSLDTRRPNLHTVIKSILKFGQGFTLTPEQLWGINFIGVNFNSKWSKNLKRSVVGNVFLGNSSSIPLYSLRKLSDWINFLACNVHALDLWDCEIDRTRLKYVALSKNSKIVLQFRKIKKSNLILKLFLYWIITTSRFLNLYWIIRDRKYSWFKDDGITLNLNPTIEQRYLTNEK